MTYVPNYDYLDWKSREEESRLRSMRVWEPQVVAKLANGARVEIDRDNKLYYVAPSGARRRIWEMPK